MDMPPDDEQRAPPIVAERPDGETNAHYPRPNGPYPKTNGRNSAAGRPSPWLVDLLLGTSVALVIALIIATDQREEQAPDAVAYLFAVAFGGLMLIRRASPRTMLALTVGGLFAYYIIGYPPIGVAIPVVAALYSAAELGRMLWSVGAGVVVLAVSTYFRAREGDPVAFLVGYELVSNGALMAAAIALGDGVRTRRARKAEQEEIHRLTALQLAREADRRVQSERESIARDLHDQIGHTTSVIALHSNVAAEAIGRDDATAREAIDRIRAAAAWTMQELRATVRILRSPAAEDGHSDARTVFSLAGVEGLVRSARSAGVEVSTQVELIPDELSAAIDSAAYRVVQEALTNVIRHADATRAEVRAALRDGFLYLVVSDNGRGLGGAEQRTGYGLAGMAERVRLLGGSLTARSEAGKGFTVEAQLPARLVP